MRMIFSICELQEVSKGRMAVKVLATDDSELGIRYNILSKFLE